MRVLTVVLVALMPLFAHAQSDGLPTVETEGTATVTVAPETVTFTLHFQVTRATTAESMTEATAWEESLKKTLKEMELTPGQITMSDYAVAQARPRNDGAPLFTVRRSAGLMFSVAPFITNTKGLLNYAALCDTMIALSGNLDCVIDGPEYDITNRDEVVSLAITRAMEDAYPSGTAMTGAMGAQIYAVENATLKDIRWNNEPNRKSPQPGLTTFTCWVKVHVAYSFTGLQQ
jgi:uncharacterized protein YggE